MTTETTTTTTETVEIPALAQMVLEKAREEAEAANAIAERWQAANAGSNKEIRARREDPDTTDENIRRYQEHVEKLRAAEQDATDKINEYIRGLIGSEQMSDEEREQAKEQHKAHKKVVNATLSALEAMFSPEDAKRFIEAANIPSVLGLSGARSSGGGTGTRRPRLASVTVDGNEVWGERTNKQGETEKYVTMTLVAEYISKLSGETVSPGDLNDAMYAAAGGDISDVTDVDFNYSVNGTDYNIVAIPRSSS